MKRGDRLWEVLYGQGEGWCDGARWSCDGSEVCVAVSVEVNKRFGPEEHTRGKVAGEVVRRFTNTDYRTDIHTYICIILD